MDHARQKVFVACDLRTGKVRESLEASAGELGDEPSLLFADAGGLLPGIRAADKVLIIHPPDSAVVSVAFETGVALGLGKPIAFLEDRSTPAIILSWAVALLAGLHVPESAIVSRQSDLWRRLREPSTWHEVPLPAGRPGEGAPLILCPEEGVGKELREIVLVQRPGWSAPNPEDSPAEVALQAREAARLLWVVTKAPLHRQRGNILSALAAGISFARSSGEGLEVLRERGAPAVQALQHLERTFEGPEDFKALALPPDLPAAVPFLAVERLEIRNFKNIPHLVLDFTVPSSLAGDWTCIAGINGSGKSSILQALAMVLLGEKQVTELGGERLRKMLRCEEGESFPVEIAAELHDGETRHFLSLSITREEGARSRPPLDDPIWQRLQNQVIVSYGASRNLSEYRETRYASLSPQVQRQMTLFDSLARIPGVEVLLEGGPSDVPVLKTLKGLLEVLLREEVAPGMGTDRLVFGQRGTEVEAVDLPDGFRSTIAWLADLCATWHRTAPPAETATSDSKRIRALVLLDEIDLHLHPSLQRDFVPRLRQALPQVQFVVTTHSPLVLSSFDRAELVVLDRDEDDGIRELDRQIFGFSTDQVYEWLMGTPPQSTVIEEKLQQGNDPDLALYLYRPEEPHEDKLRAELEERHRLIQELLGRQVP